MTKTIVITSQSKVPLGDIVITANARSVLTSFEVSAALLRHSRGDWGNVPPDDARLNDEALQSGDRLLSVYESGRQRFWIITEADRSVTTILLPEDY